MVWTSRFLSLWLLFVISLEVCVANSAEAETPAANEDDVVYDIDSLYEFLAARGRRGKEDDLFWANRGKRAGDHERQIRDSLSNHPKPNGFMFLMGKRSMDNEMKKNNLKPNGFHFLLSGKRSSMPRPNSFLFPVKRDAQNFNFPRPNGFMFPQALGKRATGQQAEEYFNIPRPTSFFWPSLNGKRANEDYRSAAWMQNLARPTGFMFSMAKGKKSDNLESADDVIMDEFDDVTDFEDSDDVIDPRQVRSLDESKEVATFFAGRGKRETVAGAANSARAEPSRGKKDYTDVNSFWAGRG